LIVGSYLILAYIVSGSAEYLFEGQFSENRRKKRMGKKIADMEDHYIVAGYGRVGRQVAQELADEGVEFIVVDRSETEIKEATLKGYAAVMGDPIKEETLQAAGIERAKSLLAALGTDTDNLFLVLTAKSLNSDLYIVARASEEESVGKLEKAGADRVALPYQIGGYHMAAVALRPAVVDFLDVIVDGKHTEMQIEEIHAERGSKMVGAKITEFFSRKKNGITVLAINHPDGTSMINPSGDEIITRDDQLIVMGTKPQLEAILKEVS
jgi:voltage-gated potassium channel